MTSEKMDAYCKEIRKLEGKFYSIKYTHVVQDKNQAADELSKLGSSRAQVPHGMFVQDLVKPSIKDEADQVVEKPPDQHLVATVPPPNTTDSSLTTLVVPPTTNTDDWRVPFIKFLQDGTGYADRAENERLMHRSKQYLLVDGVLMRKNEKEEVLMKCITREAGIQLLHEIIVVLAAITPPLGPWSAKLSEQVSTRHLPWPMQRSWSIATTDASFLPNVYTYQHMRSKPYQPPGPFAC
jgi:hypothetical protein